MRTKSTLYEMQVGMRAETNEIERIHIVEWINKCKIGSLRKWRKLTNLLDNWSKKKEEAIINNIWEKEGITRNATEFKRY